MNKYKMSLRVKKIIPETYFDTILGNFKHNFSTVSMCVIKPTNHPTIFYLNIYLNELISVDTFIDLCIILSYIKNSETDNIKLKDLKTFEIVYSLIPLFEKKKRPKIQRKYIKIF
jgi:hypothetical protein